MGALSCACCGRDRCDATAPGTDQGFCPLPRHAGKDRPDRCRASRPVHAVPARSRSKVAEGSGKVLGFQNESDLVSCCHDRRVDDESTYQGLLKTRNFSAIPELFKRPAKTLRWYLWHGKIRTAATNLQWLMVDCVRLCKDDPAVRDAVTRVQVRCRELYTYLANNMDNLTYYGWRHRSGFPISSSRAEGCVDDIGNTRMGKRRRMRWSPKGAHRVAVIRTAVLDGRLTGAYRRAAA